MTRTATSVAGDGVPRFRGHGRRLHVCGEVAGIWHAHRQAAAGGTRGVLYLSGSLADDPKNILLLCDTHHRLVDTVAKADFPAATLSEMRLRGCEAGTTLLDALAFAPMPVFCVAWPVHRQRIALPSPQQIGRALRPIGARLNGTLRTFNDNEAVLRSLEGVGLWDAMATAVEQTAADILLQAHGEGYRAALFAMGLMPVLIALGAKLGNKCEITPMLRYRENGLWYWPMNVPRGEFFTVEGLDQLSDREAELCLLLGLTAVPEAMRSTAESLGMGVVSVFARTEYLGNGALGHPDDGASFRQRMQELLHRLGPRTVFGECTCCRAHQRGVCILRPGLRQLSPGPGDLRLCFRRKRHGPQIDNHECEQRMQGRDCRGWTLDSEEERLRSWHGESEQPNRLSESYALSIR